MKLVEEIPEQRQGQYWNDETRRVLRENPGKWGVIREDISHGSSYAAGLRKSEKNQDFEFVARDRKVYATYVGDKKKTTKATTKKASK